MTSLAEVYEGHVGVEASPRQLYASVGLFLAGALLVVSGIVVATTDVLAGMGVPAWQAWEVAGVVAGLGLPAMVLGIFVVLPATRRVRAAAGVGAFVAVVGVALFGHAFPFHWRGDPVNLAPLAVGVYFLGAVTLLWSLFAGVATFKRRNDPGGTVTLEVTRGGETRVIEVARDAIDGELGAGGVGLLGGTPDGDVATQTNDLEDRTAGAVRSADDGGGRDGGGTGFDGAPAGATPASDGGATEPGVRSPADDAEVMRAGPDPRTATDSYCGNCQHFKYVSTSRGMRPFCALHDGVMDDMDACEEWEPNQLD